MSIFLPNDVDTQQKIDILPDTQAELPTFRGNVGRQRTDDEVDDILDFIAQYGYCAQGLSRRMELYYMKHERLPERKKRFARERREQTGKHKAVAARGDGNNILPYERRSSG